MRHYCRDKGKDGVWYKDGLWYDGYHIRMSNKLHYIFPEYNDNKLQEVDENTITEYTRQYDKNNIEICEGDIVQLKYRKSDITSVVGVVKFGEYKLNRYDEFPRYFGYYISVKKIVAPYVNAGEVILDGEISIGLIDIRYDGEIKIIGNIFDNPELLKI